MKDFLDQTLNLGDKVVYNPSGKYKLLAKGFVVGFTDKNIRVSSKFPDPKSYILRLPSVVVKYSGV